jgi:geranylgeranyl diphosphate synthase, type II
MSDTPAIAARSLRQPQDNVPQTRQARDELLQAVREYVERIRPVPPLSLEELRVHTNAILDKAGIDRKYADFAAILVNNESWRETVAAIPYEKRLLLLPKCLRHATECPASFDEVGLLCRNCGRCVIDDFKSQAERLGYAVLIAEGSPVVMSLIEAGRIEAVIGASCLSVLEGVFPYMEAGAVPGLAIPLLRDGCANTHLDVDWLWEAIYQTADDPARRLDLEALHRQVNEWFSHEMLSQMIAQNPDETQKIAVEWMAKAGKRWRPFLGVCACRALSLGGAEPGEEDLRRIAVAVECFHKASLIHDDIEDGDAERYGGKTLHGEYGVPVALNIGDFLLGEGYRLLAEAGGTDALRVKLLRAAVHGHRTLCLGQGRELAWRRNPKPLTVGDVLDTFRMKTAPAFEVALNLGAVLAGCDEQIGDVPRKYSDALGIAYQIRDDLDDLGSPERIQAGSGGGPSVLLALAYETADEAGRGQIEKYWSGPVTAVELEQVCRLISSPQVEAAAWRLMETYRSQAIEALIPLKNAGLKGLLRRVMGKIFNDFDIMGCCNDRQARHAPGRS